MQAAQPGTDNAPVPANSNVPNSGDPRKRRAARMLVNCPHCDAPAAGRSSDRLTPLLREIYYQCSNHFCGHVFVATLEIIRTVTPSQCPRQGVNIKQLQRGTHLPLEPPANDPGG